MERGFNGLASPLLEHVERAGEIRRRMYGHLCWLGLSLRLLTLMNGSALIAAAAYSFYLFGIDELSDTRASVESRTRTALEYALMLSSGVFLVVLEHASTAHEAGARRSLGLAYSGGGRCLLMLALAFASSPAIHLERSILEAYATGGAVGALAISAILQGWMLSCVPEYREHVVAELDTPRVQVDHTKFPQIYQRDEGAYLHMGVLLPGFASRESCTMSANCSRLTLVGDISHLEAPFSPVDPHNSTAGPFGPFERDVELAHPVDITVPVESRMGLGILEFKFQKGVPEGFHRLEASK